MSEVVARRNGAHPHHSSLGRGMNSCVACGAENEEDVIYCVKCGRPIEPPAPPPEFWRYNTEDLSGTQPLRTDAPPPAYTPPPYANPQPAQPQAYSPPQAYAPPRPQGPRANVNPPNVYPQAPLAPQSAPQPAAPVPTTILPGALGGSSLSRIVMSMAVVAACVALVALVPCLGWLNWLVIILCK